MKELITSSKDLDYLTDMFNWNYMVYKNTTNSINQINDNEIKNHFKKTIDKFYEVMNEIIKMMEEINE